jgi:hypothetical protein
MTLRALQGRMRPCERKACNAVIKGCVQPRSCIVAALASLRESERRMVWIIGTLIILQVTGNACCAAQAEIVVDMTLRALQCRVGSG